MRTAIRAALVPITAVLLAACSAERDRALEAPRAPWQDEVVELFATLPVQERGRVKPLSTLASFAMLRINGKRSHRTPWGERLTPTEWLLDVLFYPEIARDYEVFMVADDAVLDAIGVAHEGRKRRDRYAYTDLHPARAELDELARSYAKIDAKERTTVQGGIVRLWHNMGEFMSLYHALDFARAEFAVDRSEGQSLLFPERDRVRFSEALRKMPAMVAAFRELRDAGSGRDAEAERRRERELEAFRELVREIEFVANKSRALAIIPPDERNETAEYLTAGDVMMAATGDAAAAAGRVALLGRIEEMAAARDDRATFREEAEAFHDAVTGMAAARGDYGKIGLEVTYYRLDLFFYALVLYTLSFLILAVSWLFPGSRWLSRALGVAVTLPTLMVVGGIVLRCIIRSRPPITGLYETIPFITATGVLAALVIELINRKRVAIAIGSILGAIGMAITFGYELKGDDTMDVLPAVLDTNFWLAVHVPTINIGYAACLLAGLIAHVYLLGRLFGLKKGNPAFYRDVGRMVYGVTCFGLIFSVVGTILGGIWANDSWGRFWGWDPKENGALMIVIWGIIMLHARMGGYVRYHGLSMMAVVLGMVVAFSWWGVNLLGVGLHSYGFTSGVFRWLLGFYAFETLVLILGGIALLVERAERRGAAMGGAPPAGGAAGDST